MSLDTGGHLTQVRLFILGMKSQGLTALGPPAQYHPRVLSVQGDTAVVHTANAAVATVLRFRAPAIVAFLRERYNPAVADLQIKVQPDTYTAI